MTSSAIELGRVRAAELGEARFLAWPGTRHLLFATALGGANALWFMAVFVGCDLVTASHAWRVPVHFEAELAIPFVPSMTAAYMSMYALFAAGPFILRTRRELTAAVATLAAIIGIAGIFFLLLPAPLAFEPVRDEQLGAWTALFRLADDLNLTFNLVPSLHVALSVACAAAFATRATLFASVLLWAWVAAIAASTLLIHQHHIVDVVTGWILALVVFDRIYRRLAR